MKLRVPDSDLNEHGQAPTFCGHLRTGQRVILVIVWVYAGPNRRVLSSIECSILWASAGQIVTVSPRQQSLAYPQAFAGFDKKISIAKPGY